MEGMKQRANGMFGQHVDRLSTAAAVPGGQTAPSRRRCGEDALEIPDLERASSVSCCGWKGPAGKPAATSEPAHGHAGETDN